MKAWRLAAAATLLTQSSRFSLDQRTIVSDFSYVTAIAASPFTVFAATTHGLAIYDRRTEQWALPITTADGYPRDPVRAAMADAVDDAVWLGTASGWARYDNSSHQWDSGIAAGGVSDFMMDSRDPADGIYMRTFAGWQFLQRGTVIPTPGRPLPPPNQRLGTLTPDAAFARAPGALATRALLLTDARMRSYHFTCAAMSADRTEIFFGTDGMGVLRYDPAGAQSDQMSVSLIAPRAGAVATGNGGVWVATDAGAGERRGLVWLASDLTRARAVEGRVTPGMSFFQGRRLLVAGDVVWLATEQGVYRATTDGGQVTRFGAEEGLPSANILALAPAPDGVWVGTDRGLAVITNEQKVVRVGTLVQPVISLLAVRETLWVGTTAGLGILPPGQSEPGLAADVADQPALKVPILALARAHDTLLVATQDHYAWRDPATLKWTILPPRGDVGAATAIVAGGDGVWIGGPNGVANWDVAHARFSVLHVPYDVPAGAHDLALDANYLWVATDSGVVRFERGAAR